MTFGMACGRSDTFGRAKSSARLPGRGGGQVTSTIDPEVQEILNEVLSDPESTLTRMPKSWPPSSSIADAISSGDPWLTRAERHLLRAHRESVSLILYN